MSSDYPYGRQRKYGTWAARFMDTVGDGTGSTQANVNGAVTPVDFYYGTLAGEIAIADRLIVSVKDTGNFDVDNYGNGLVIPNGILLGMTDPDDNFVIVNQAYPVKTTGDWAAIAHDIQLHTFGIGDNVLTVRYTFVKDGAPILIPPKHKLTIRIQDDFTGLTGHRFRIGAITTPAGLS